jgi:hypothetical protein
MSETSGTWEQATFWDLPSVISSAALRAGPSPSPSPDGTETDLCGQGVVPANPTRRLGSNKAMKTPETYGPHFTGSSASVVLTLSLGNRLRERFGTGGSMEYVETWRTKATPLGRLYSAHTASARPISDSDCSGWPTPVSQPANGTPEDFLRRKRESVARGSSMGICLSDLAMVAALAGGPPPQSHDAQGGKTQEQIAKMREESKAGVSNLNEVCLLAGWPTPTECASKQTVKQWEERNKAAKAKNPNLGSVEKPLEVVVQLTGWGTPSARDHKDAGEAFEANPEMVPVESRLPWLAALAGWVTPGANDVGTPNQGRMKTDRETRDPSLSGSYRMDLHDQVGLISGPTASSSPAPTEKRGESRGVLNPAFSLYLMGFPLTWAACGLRAMASTRSRKKSKGG